MNNLVHLYSFGDADRSGKVRWTAAELGLEVEEHRVRPGAHRAPPYLDMNPYGHIPAVEFQDQTLIESTAICISLSDAAGPHLQVDRGEIGRKNYLYWMSVFTETHESRLVEAIVSKGGLIGPEYYELHKDVLARKLKVLAAQLPLTGWLAGERFTLADICAGYSLRLAQQLRLLTREDVNPYFDRLLARPGAIVSRIFDGLE